MREAGAILYREVTNAAAMGFSALRRVREMLKLLRWARTHFAKTPPDLDICVDSPALNFHFAKAAHERGIPVLYYVAPQLWAWREGRMKKLRRWVDRVACILPFEEEYFRSHGVNAKFVGHPLLDELSPSERPKAAAVRNFGDAPVVGLLAGSRRSEATKNFPRMLQIAMQIRKRFPKVKFLLPTTAATNPILQQHLAAIPSSCFEAKQDAFDEMVPRCDLAIIVSGTATLHVAVHNTPMIVVYHGSPLLWNALGRWIIRTRTYSLVNLLAADPQLAAAGRVAPDMHIVPEFIPWYGPTQPAAARALDLLEHPAKLAKQREDLAKVVARLGGPGASMKAAQMAMEMIERATSRQ